MKTKQIKPFELLLLNKLGQHLKLRVGRDKAVSARQLAKEVGSRDREVRRVLSLHADYLWSRQIRVISAISGGFYCGADLEEFQRARDYLTGFGRTIAQKVKDLDRLCAEEGISLEKRRA